MQVQRTSTLTGLRHVLEIDITEDQLSQWRNGQLIQNVAPHLSANDREFLISGITPEEWNAAFVEGLE